MITSTDFLKVIASVSEARRGSEAEGEWKICNDNLLLGRLKAREDVIIESYIYLNVCKDMFVPNVLLLIQRGVFHNQQNGAHTNY